MTLLTTAVILVGFTPRFSERMALYDGAAPLALWVHTIVATR